MMLCRLSWFLVLFGLCSIAVDADAPVSQETATTKPQTEADNSKILLKQFLVKEGEKFGCYFTIEDDTRDGNDTYLGDIKVIAKDATTIDSLVDSLKKEVPSAVFQQSLNNPKVIHVIAASLTQDKGYVMNEKASLSYSGVLGNLPQELNKHTSSHIGPRPFFYEGEASDDLITFVTIKAKDVSVRDLLTDYIPLANYKRVIWVSVTHHNAGKLDTWIQYYGPIRIVSQSK